MAAENHSKYWINQSQVAASMLNWWPSNAFWRLFIPKHCEDCHNADRENRCKGLALAREAATAHLAPGSDQEEFITSPIQTTAASQGVRCNSMLFSSLRCWFFLSLQAWSSLLSWPTVAPSGGGAACTVQFAKDTKIAWEAEFCIHPASCLCPVQAEKKKTTRSLNKKFNPTEQWKLQHSSLILTGSFPKYYFYGTSLVLCQ